MDILTNAKHRFVLRAILGGCVIRYSDYSSECDVLWDMRSKRLKITSTICGTGDRVVLGECTLSNVEPETDHFPCDRFLLKGFNKCGDAQLYVPHHNVVLSDG